MANGLQPIPELPTDLVIQMDDLSAWVSKTTIRTQKSYTKASDTLKTFQTMRKAVPSHYKAIKDPLNAARKQVLDMEKTDLHRLQPAEDRLKTLILDYQDRKTAEDNAAAAEAIATAHATGHPLTPQVASIAVPDGQHTRTYTRVVVVDFAALVQSVAKGETPIDALEPNQGYLNKLVAQTGASLFAVPGCTVEQHRTVVTR